MTTPKIRGLVNSCGGCPNYEYYSGGTHRCKLVDERVQDKTVIAPFCPLPDYPARLIASMETTIAALRLAQHATFATMLLSHVAACLNLNLHADAISVRIPFKEGDKDREVNLTIMSITELKPYPVEITFLDQQGTFKLRPDALPPVLLENKLRDLWLEHKL